MSEALPRMLVSGALLDDATFYDGDLLSLHRERPFTVHILSVTNGAPGHYKSSGDTLGREVNQGAQSPALHVYRGTSWNIDNWVEQICGCQKLASDVAPLGA